MADDTNTDEPTQTDIFQQQKQTINTLINVLEQQGSATSQPVFMPAAEAAPAPPNYLLYIAIALGAYLLLKRS